MFSFIQLYHFIIVLQYNRMSNELKTEELATYQPALTAFMLDGFLFVSYVTIM